MPLPTYLPHYLHAPPPWHYQDVRYLQEEREAHHFALTGQRVVSPAPPMLRPAKLLLKPGMAYHPREHPLTDAEYHPISAYHPRPRPSHPHLLSASSPGRIVQPPPAYVAQEEAEWGGHGGESREQEGGRGGRQGGGEGGFMWRRGNPFWPTGGLQGSLRGSSSSASQQGRVEEEEDYSEVEAATRVISQLSL